MGLVLQIVLGLAILASFFVAYMSSKTWQIYQAVVVAFIFLGCVAFFYLSARTLATHDSVRTSVKRAQADLERTEKELQQLIDGSGEQDKGVRQLRLDLANITADRGGVLYDVKVAAVKDGNVQVAPVSANHGLAVNNVVFAFDQLDQDKNGHFQGEFKVVAIGDEGKSVELTPNLPLTKAQAARVADAEGPWTLYTRMPIDELTAGAAERALVDFELQFHEGFVQRSLLADSVAKLNSNIARINAAIKSTEAEIAYRGNEQEALAADLEQFQRETNAIGAYRTILENRLELLLGMLKATYAHNRELAGEWTARQSPFSGEIRMLAPMEVVTP